MADGIDIVGFVRDVSARMRGRACVVMTHDFKGQQDWATKLARLSNAEHIDLLDLFEKEEMLGNNLASYQPEGVFSLLKNRVKQGTAVVSGIEFLKASWTGRQNSAEEFAARLEMWQDDPALVFVMQYDKAIAERPFRRFRQYSFIIDQRETFAI